MPKPTASVAALVAAIGCSATVVNAADISPAPYDWTGLHVGLNAGVAWTNTEIDNDVTYVGNVSPPSEFLVGLKALGKSLSGDSAAFTGGAVAGYNWQHDSLVLGVETDINYLGFGEDNESDGDISKDTCGADCGYSNGVSFDADWFGTLRGRLGFAADNVLFYGTGGLAYGHMEASSDFKIYDNISGDLEGTWKGYSDEVNWGWTVGAGLEYGVDSWSVGLEYLFVDLGGADWDASVSDTSRLKSGKFLVTEGSVDYQFSVVRATAKIRF